jgi:hypothetical protein
VGHVPRPIINATCVVTIREDGPHLERNLKPWPVTYPQLELMALFSRDDTPTAAEGKDRVAALTGTPEPELAPFVIDLRYAGHLAPGEPVRHLDVVDHPAAGTGGPADLTSADLVRFPVPQALRLRAGAFELLDHAGRRAARLSAAQVAALGALGRPSTLAEAFAALPLVGGEPVLSADDFALLVGRLEATDSLRRQPAGEDTSPAPRPGGPDTEATEPEPDIDLTPQVFARHAAEQTRAEREREQRTGQVRTRVVPVAFDVSAPAGLGMIVAYARAHDGGSLEEHYQFRTDWVWSDDRLEEFTAEPAVYLCSDYVWSHRQCLAVSARVKELSPDSVTIHGGPDAPKYEGDAAAYLQAHPYVDVLVRGEGEVTAAEALAALAPVIGSPSPDLTVLDAVPGLTYRVGDRLVRTPDRDRQADLAQLPSPVLTGLFDRYAEIPLSSVTLETNRGCPYGCTFCDWGSATNSRIRKFDMDRILAEIDWCAQHRIETIGLADANFGIFERDVDVARHVAEVHRSVGFPNGFGVSYAKNTTKYLRQIISVLSEAGILSMGVLSLQTMDPATLQTIRRSNIKTEKYDAIAEEMRKAHLPLMVELMMGLPGQTRDSFADDLQQCINRSVPARINMTTLLVNSPMNAPEYLAEHQIETVEPPRPGHNAMLVATRSYTRHDYTSMARLRAAFMAYENFGLLRLVARFVRHQTGRREIDVYRAICDLTDREPNRWPALTALDRFATTLMAPPYSWPLVMHDIGRLAVEELGVTDDGALRSILAAQTALLPAYGRTFPDRLTLEHDVVAWNQAVTEAKALDPSADWTGTVAQLGTYGPGGLLVEDPGDVCSWAIGIHAELNSFGANWELASPLARAAIVSHQEILEAAVALVTLRPDQLETAAVPMQLGTRD